MYTVPLCCCTSALYTFSYTASTNQSSVAEELYRLELLHDGGALYDEVEVPVHALPHVVARFAFALALALALVFVLVFAEEYISSSSSCSSSGVWYSSVLPSEVFYFVAVVVVVVVAVVGREDVARRIIGGAQVAGV